MKTIIGIKISERNNDAIKLQEILTKYGCQIETRIGLHDHSEDICSNNGIVLLDTVDDCTELVKELEKNWTTKTISL